MVIPPIASRKTHPETEENRSVPVGDSVGEFFAREGCVKNKKNRATNVALTNNRKSD